MTRSSRPAAAPARDRSGPRRADPRQPAARTRQPKIPAAAAVGLGVLGAAVALLQSYLYSLIAYALVLVLGFVLIYLQRHLANKATVSSQSTQAQTMPLIERFGIWTLLAACLFNGLVVALHISRFGLEF